MKRLRIITALIAAAVIAACACGVSAFGFASVDAYSAAGYSFRDSDALAPKNADEYCVFPDLTDGGWSCAGLVSDSFTHKTSGVLYYCAEMHSDMGFKHRSGGATFTLKVEDAEIDAADYGTLSFALGIRGGGATGRAFFVSTYISTTVGTVVAQTSVEGAVSSSDLSLVTCDISEIEGTLKSLRVSVMYDSGKLPDNIMLSSPFLAKAEGGFGGADEYLAAGFTAEKGSFSADDGKVTTDRNGDALITAHCTGGYAECGGKAYLFADLSGVRSGSMQVSITYCENVSGLVVTEESPRISLTAEETEYVFPFDADGIVMSYRLNFSGVSSDGGFTLGRIRIAGGETASAERGLGKLGSVSTDGKTVRFSGTVERETAKKYSDGEIGFYALPSADGSAQAVLLGSVRITTKFDYTADLTEFLVSADTYMFTAAIITPDGEIIGISAPRYCDAAMTERTAGPKLGFCDTPAVSAFEANASHIIIDVPLDRLLGAGEGKTYSSPYTVYGLPDSPDGLAASAEFDSEILGGIDSSVNFCMSAGMKVYLRLTAECAIDGMTYGKNGADNYALRPAGEENRQLYAHIVRFLAERYGGIDGFVIGKDALDGACTGTEITPEPAEYLIALADTCRITYNACADSSGSPVIIVPMSSGGECSPRTASVMLADRMSDIGEIPLSVMLLTDSFEADDTETVYKAVSEMGSGALVSMTAMCGVDEDKLRDGYASDGGEMTLAEYTAMKTAEFCAAETRAEAVFVSLGGTEVGRGRDLFSALKRLNDNGAVVESGAELAEDGTDGVYFLWDFRDKYYPLGWSAIGVDSCRSDFRSLSGDRNERCLRAEFNKGDNGAAGILLCTFDKTADLTKAEKMTVTLSGKGTDPDGYISAAFVIGTDDERAEYSANIPADGSPCTLTCDLTAYDRRDAVDFVGVLIYSDGAAEIEIESIGMSGKNGAEGLGEIFDPPVQPEEEKKTDASFALIIAAVLALLTFGIFFMLYRREKDAREQKKSDSSDGRYREKI